MGYRSDFCMVIEGKEEELLTAYAKYRVLNPYKADAEDKDPLIADSSFTREGNGRAVFVCADEGWKWYQGFPAIDQLEHWFEFCERLNSDEPKAFGSLSGAFLRLGEDDNDVQSNYWGDDPYDLVQLHRAIGTTYSVQRDLDIRSQL